ncbi:Tripartite motif-containing protein 16 [Merluccius polli]|uniref:Tripartite motif-containing protein 16 n=1 Tax=Merluccius polli TaxID=89951 RepID=A0AA47NA94_MERPO|nr:Tripartite motif-containing protein 16 [Merluccius polli]
MGASLDTPPAPCPLCYQLMRDPVVLKCKHRFCHRCIGDLWSGSPSGPYHCPEWRCSTVYRTLPFGARRATASETGTETSSSGQGAAAPGTSSEWSTPSFTRRFLGKRKASAPVDQQPDAKRPAADPPRAAEPRNEPPETPAATPSAPVPPVPPVPDEVESPPSSSSGDDRKSPTNSDASADEAEEVSVRQKRPWPEPEVTILVDSNSDSGSEADTFATASAFATSAADLEETNETGFPWGRPPSPAASNPSTSRADKPSPRRVSWPSPLFAKRPVPTPAARLSPPAPPSPNISPPRKVPTTSHPPQASPVPCHYCASPAQQLAVKTCLVCGASMCAEHLRPHLESPVFRSHTLVAPIDDLSAWRCPEHQELSRIYCQQCALCVCTVCTVIGSHRDHACVSIREAEKELRVGEEEEEEEEEPGDVEETGGNLKEEIKQLQGSEHTLMERLAELKQKKLDFQGMLEEARAKVQQQYEAMREALEQEERSALQCVVQEETKAIGGLESHLGRLQGSLMCVQKGLHTLEGLADAKGEQRVQEQAFIMEYSKITQMFSEVGPCVVDLDSPGEVDRARLKCLQRWTEKRLNNLVISLPERDPYRLLYGTMPSLDADTAHPKLLLSDDNRQVAYCEVQQAYAEQGARFSGFPQVLASKAMDQGRWYWEVEVSSEDAGHWKVGLCEAQIARKGQKSTCRLGFNPHSWCLGAERGKVEAMHDKAAVSVATERLQRIGVFLDCDEGVLSFYSVTPGGALALLHTYRQRFAEPLYPAFSVCKAQLTICDLFKM